MDAGPTPAHGIGKRFGANDFHMFQKFFFRHRSALQILYSTLAYTFVKFFLSLSNLLPPKNHTAGKKRCDRRTRAYPTWPLHRFGAVRPPFPLVAGIDLLPYRDRILLHLPHDPATGSLGSCCLPITLPLARHFSHGWKSRALQGQCSSRKP